MAMFTTNNTARKTPYYFYFNEDNLSGCCGIKVLYELERYPLPLVKSHAKDAISKLIRITHPRSMYEAVCLVSVNSEMKPVWHPILRKAGFVVRSSGNNKNTGNNVFLYSKVIHKTKRGR